MSNNVNVTEGSGKTVATEDIGGSQYQQIKISGGQTGSTSMMGVNPDGSINVSMIGAIRASITGGQMNVSVVGGTVGASILGIPTVIVGGSVATIGTAVPNQSVSGTVGASIVGIPTVIIGGSVATIGTAVANQSVSGALNVSGSVMLGSSNASVIATIQGSVAAVQSGTRITSVISSTPSSMLVGASIMGQLPAGTAVLGSVAALQGTNPWIVTSSIAGGIFPISGSVAAVITNTSVNVGGSVLAFQGGAPWIETFSNSSIIAINAGSVVAIIPGSVISVVQSSSILAVPVGSVITVLQAPSIVGTYAEDAASASGDKGFLVMGARNDTLSSVTSNDGDYSSHVVGPSGELITANAPITKWVQGNISVLNQFGVSMVGIAAQGASIFTYITGMQVANMSATQVLVTVSGATSSIIGYTTAPANGGSNIVMPNAWKSNANGAITVSVSGVSSVYVSLEGFIAKI